MEFNQTPADSQTNSRPPNTLRRLTDAMEALEYSFTLSLWDSWSCISHIDKYVTASR
jgi:hypothetical protein